MKAIKMRLFTERYFHRWNVFIISRTLWNTQCESWEIDEDFSKIINLLFNSMNLLNQSKKTFLQFYLYKNHTCALIIWIFFEYFQILNFIMNNEKKEDIIFIQHILRIHFPKTTNKYNYIQLYSKNYPT